MKRKGISRRSCLHTMCGVLCALCTIASSTASAFGGGLVLCICHDGHIQIEFDCSFSACCPDEECDTGDQSPFAAWLTNSADGTHGCVDIPLVGDYQQFGKRQFEATTPQPSSTVPVLAIQQPNFSIEVPRSVILSERSPCCSPPGYVGTTVLRI